MDGYGYQWRISAACCRAEAIASGDVGAPCPSQRWFWVLAVAVLGLAAIAPKKTKGAA